MEPHHATQRGNARRFILDGDTVRSVYLDLLKQSLALHAVAMMGYCLMSNHVHLVLNVPSAWDWLSIKNIKVSEGDVAMTLSWVPRGLELHTENSGRPVELFFSPEIPFGARLGGAELDGKPVMVRTEAQQQDTHAALRFTLPTGKSDCVIRYEGGVSVHVKRPDPLVDESSKAIKIVSIAYEGTSLGLKADISRDAPLSAIELRTNEKPLRAHRAKLIVVSDREYELFVDPASTSGADKVHSRADSAPASPGFRHIAIIVDFASDQRR